jgi:hypothetical protein
MVEDYLAVGNALGFSLQLLQALGVAILFTIPVGLAVRRLK